METYLKGNLVMKTLIRRNVRCSTRIHQIDTINNIGLRAEDIAKDGLLIIDEYNWDFDWKILRKVLDRTQRYMHQPFINKSIPSDIRKQIQKVKIQLEELFHKLYPNYEYMPRNGKSVRPLMTGPEPMHFDTFDTDGKTPLTAYINIDTQPRIYAIGHTFEYLTTNYDSFFKKHIIPVWKKTKQTPGNLVRAATSANIGPLKYDSPKHYILFEPKSVWFFNPKLVSHEVVYGGGTICSSWWLTNVDFPTQEDLVSAI